LGYNPGHAEETPGFLLGKLVPPGAMPLRDNQTVPLGEGVDVQYPQGELVFVDAMGRGLPCNYFTKDASRIGFVIHDLPPRGDCLALRFFISFVNHLCGGNFHKIPTNKDGINEEGKRVYDGVVKGERRRHQLSF
jgi:hypothetical protein